MVGDGFYFQPSSSQAQNGRKYNTAHNVKSAKLRFRLQLFKKLLIFSYLLGLVVHLFN